MDITQEKNRNTRKSFPESDPRVEFFNHHAPNWDTTGPNIDEVLNRLNQIKARLGFSSGMDVMEVGCGTGQITGWLIDIVKPGRVVSVDIAPEMIRIATNKKIPNANFKVMDICAPIRHRTKYDAVFCFNSFPHFRDKNAALQNIKKLLKPNGYLLVLHFSGSKELNEFHRSVGGAVGEDKLPYENEWRQLLTATGFRLTEFEDRPDLFLLRAAKID
ncbi:MAG: class I SAM-dependent methyltransferase [Verrucomicrobiia bacterium]